MSFYKGKATKDGILDGWYVAVASGSHKQHYFQESQRSLCGKFQQHKKKKSTSSKCTDCFENFLSSPDLHPLKVDRLDRRELERLRDIKKVEER